MPLPDERPRQSVANLIGKFEVQTKRLSLSAGTPSRSNSVVSHITGDSAKEEIKEKREWPPKSVTDKEKDRLPPTSYRHLPPAVNTTPPTPKDANGDEVPLTAKALNASHIQAEVEPNAFLENWRKELPEPTEMVPEPATATVAPAEVQPKAAAASTSKTASSRSAPPKTPIGKPPAKATSATPTRSVAKPTTTKSKPSLAPSAMQPLKPQHTGQSATSTTTSARRLATKTPTTPQSKTPARSDLISRAKTPTSARPKTPSSGLFAPTAASLARARGAGPTVPQPVKKTAISTSTMERLSKPTTASLAKAKSASGSSAPPPKAPTSPPKSTTVKGKPTTSTSTSKSKPATKEGVLKSTATPAATVAVAAEAASEETNGHTEDVVPEPPVTIEEVADAVVDVPPQDEPALEEPIADDHDVTPRSPSPAQVAVKAEEDVELEPVAQKDDLADIVNLLESVTVSKPTPPPDDLLEIPDVEEEN